MRAGYRHKKLIVTPHPDAQFSVTSPVCIGANSVVLHRKYASAITYSWNFDGGTAIPGGNNPGPHNVSWSTAGLHNLILTVTKYSCQTKDSSFITVNPVPPAPVISQNNLVLMSSTATTYQWFLNGNIISGATSHFIPFYKWILYC